MDETMLYVGTTSLVLVFMVFLFACGIFLGRRAVKLHLEHIWFLSFFFIILGVQMILTMLWYLGLPRPAFFDSINLHACVIMLLAFTHKAFFKERRSPFKLLVLITSLIGTINVLLGFIQDDPAFTKEARLWRTFFFWFELVIASVWQTRVSLHEHRRFKAITPRLEPYVLKRYLLHGLTSLLFVPILIVDLVGTWFDVFGGGSYLVTTIVTTAMLVLYTSMHLLIWVMPAWFKNRLNKGVVFQLVAEYEGVPAPPTDLSKKHLTSREKMAIIDHLGKTLARKVNIKPSAAKGLILIAIDQHESQSNSIGITLLELKGIFLEEIQGILTRVGIKEPDKIVKEMVEEIVADQSLLTMMSI